MQQPPPNDRRTQERSEVPSTDDTKPVGREPRALKEVLETAASAYFSACRKLARTINRLKQK